MIDYYVAVLTVYKLMAIPLALVGVAYLCIVLIDWWGKK